MNIDDLTTFSSFGKALWTDPEYCEKATVETMTAASLLNVTADKMLERASSALLERAQYRGVAENSRMNLSSLGSPFFRLSVEERIVLTALYLGHWSYERLGRVLRKSADEVQEIAWSARVQCGAPKSYPGGPSGNGRHCPEYHPNRPWTQEFLDEEVKSGRERAFLQNHLLGCDSCKDALIRAKELYFNVQREVNSLREGLSFEKKLEDVLNSSPMYRQAGDRTLAENLDIFSRRWDVRFMLVVMAILIGWCFGNYR